MLATCSTNCRYGVFFPAVGVHLLHACAHDPGSALSSFPRRGERRLPRRPPRFTAAVSPRREWAADWVPRNDDLVRALPVAVGAAALLAVLINRAVSGIAPVADASSSQSRADLLTLSLAVTNILSGLVWLSIRPKNLTPVLPAGVQCKQLRSSMSEGAIRELMWAWDSLLAATCCKSLVVIYGGHCVLQIGVAAESVDGQAVYVDVDKVVRGSLCRSVMESKKQSYLANLALYPGRSELPFIPANTQSLILQPLGDNGIAIIGGDTIRGFSNVDQAWIVIIAEKLDVTLSKG